MGESLELQRLGGPFLSESLKELDACCIKGAQRGACHFWGSALQGLFRLCHKVPKLVNSKPKWGFPKIGDPNIVP